MPGQLVTYVPSEDYKFAYQKAGAKGIEAIFMGFYGVHGSIDNSGLLIPLEALLVGTGSVKPFRTKDYKVTTSERQFPLARLREWSMLLRLSLIHI